MSRLLSLPERAFAAAVTILTAAQMACLLLAPPERIDSRLAGLPVLALLSVGAALAMRRSRARFVALTIPALMALLLVGLQVASLSPPLPSRVLLGTTLVASAIISVVGILAAVRPVWCLPALLVATSTLAALVAGDLVASLRVNELDQREEVIWVGAIPHPDTLLDRFYAPKSSLKLVYPDNPRGYFHEASDLERRWRLATFDTTSATQLIFPSTQPGLIRVRIERTQSTEPWQIQLSESPITITRDHMLHLHFRARAERERTISVGLGQARPPWQNLGYYGTMTVDSVWRAFDFHFPATASDTGARLQFDLGGAAVDVEISDIVLNDSSTRQPVKVRSQPEYSVPYRFNDLGCRGRDYPLERRPNTLRILAIGDSYTMGVGVNEADVFTTRLEELLNRRRGGGRPDSYEVINCGVSGYSSAQERVLFERVGLRYRPDVVLVTLVWNDDRSYRDEEAVLRSSPAQARIEGLFPLWHLLIQALRERELAAHDYSRVTRELVRIRDSAEAAGARLALMVFQSDEGREWQLVTDAVVASFDTADVPLLQLGPILLQDSLPDLRVHPRMDGHPNEIAHRIASEALAVFLDQHGLLAVRN